MFSNNNTYLHLNVISSFGLNCHTSSGFKNRPGNFKSSINSLIKPMRSWPNFGIFILHLKFFFVCLFSELQEIFDAEHSANTLLTWALRGVGWVLMFIGFQMMTSILTLLSK